MKIRDVMTKAPLSVRADGSIHETAAAMRDAGIGSLPVVDGNDQLTGMVTDRDIALRAVGRGRGPETPVEEIMTRRVVYVNSSDDIEAALAMMGDHQVRRLPVAEDGRLVGIVSQADLTETASHAEVVEALRRISEPAAGEATRREDMGE